MRLIHQVPFSSQEREYYRQLVFTNIVEGMQLIIDAMETFNLRVSDHNQVRISCGRLVCSCSRINQQYNELLENAPDVRDGEAFPAEYLEPLQSLWDDPECQRALARGNEVALPEK